ncbi:hypothetical protein CTAM01_11453, partial [Colletotrichum tamarilloi]
WSLAGAEACPWPSWAPKAYTGRGWEFPHSRAVGSGVLVLVTVRKWMWFVSCKKCWPRPFPTLVRLMSLLPRVHLRPPSTNLSITFVMSCLELTGKHRGTANYSVRCISLLDRKSLSRVTPCQLGAYMPPSKVSSRWASEIAKSTWLNSPRLHPAGTELSQGITLPLSAFFAKFASTILHFSVTISCCNPHSPPSLRLLSPDEPG